MWPGALHWEDHNVLQVTAAWCVYCLEYPHIAGVVARVANLQGELRKLNVFLLRSKGYDSKRRESGLNTS